VWKVVLMADHPERGVDEPVAAWSPAGDFEAFWRAEYPAIVRITYALTGRRHVAEELAQDAFVAAYRHWAEISSYDRPGAWVRRVATNAAISSLRRRSAELRAITRLGLRRPPPSVVEIPEPDAQVWSALRSLPRRQSQVLALMVVDDLSVSEVAKVLQVSEDTVRTHARRGREALARRLGSEGVA